MKHNAIEESEALRSIDGAWVSSTRCILDGERDNNAVEAVFALHRRLVSGLPRGRVACETRAFFQEHLQQKGRLLGVFVGSQLVAYAVLGLPRAGDDNFGVDHRLSAADCARVAHLDGAGVDPHYRGNRLQLRLIEWRLEMARKFGRSLGLSTAAPENFASLANLLAGGLRICALAQKYGGTRYLLRCDLELLLEPAAEQIWIRWDDFTEQSRLFSIGWCAWALRAQPERELLFALPTAAMALQSDEEQGPAYSL